MLCEIYCENILSYLKIFKFNLRVEERSMKFAELAVLVTVLKGELKGWVGERD